MMEPFARPVTCFLRRWSGRGVATVGTAPLENLSDFAHSGRHEVLVQSPFCGSSGTVMRRPFTSALKS
jgi:hypothetical protein